MQSRKTGLTARDVDDDLENSIMIFQCAPDPFPKDWTERMSVFGISLRDGDVYFSPDFLEEPEDFLTAANTGCPMITVLGDHVLMSADWMIENLFSEDVADNYLLLKAKVWELSKRLDDRASTLN